MRSSVTLLAAQLVWGVSAIKLAPRDNPKILPVDIARRHIENPAARDQIRRRQTVQQTLDNLETLYFANASLGTPQQDFRLHIDTGSSDLWVNAANSTLCTAHGDECALSGVYDPDASSTYEFVNQNFNISYVDGSGAAGDYVKDVLHFGGKKINGMQFGVGFESSSPEGILGIGYQINEVQVNRFGGEPYPNLPALLVKNGYINTNAYSLWLNDLDASTGSILFGGVDTAKFKGTLHTLPILQTQGVYAEFIIALTEIGQNGKQGALLSTSDEAVPVLLDSGSSLMYLPDNIVRNLYDYYSASYDQTQGAAFVDCDLANQQGSLEFTFSGVTISVQLDELVIQAGISNGKPICILGIGPAGDSIAVLGDTFLRSAYVVYDLANNEISMAQTNFNATESHVEEIQKGESVPDATAVPNAVSQGPVSTGGGRNGGPSIHATGTGSNTPVPTGAHNKGAAGPGLLPNPWLGAAGVAVAAGVGEFVMGNGGLL